MKVRPRFLSLASLILASSSAMPHWAHSDECYAVTGLSTDSRGILKSYAERSSEKNLDFDHFTCKRYPSWDALLSAFRSAKPPVGERILIIQAAHGSPGGGARLEDGDVRGQDVFRALHELALANPTGFIDQSCYSGDLLARKLLFDRAHPDDPSATNLCVLSASTFNFPGENSDGLFEAINSEFHWKSGDFLKIYFKNRGGLISATQFQDALKSDDMAAAYGIKDAVGRFDFFTGTMRIPNFVPEIGDMCSNLNSDLFELLRAKLELRGNGVDSIDFQVRIAKEDLKRFRWLNCGATPLLTRAIAAANSSIELPIDILFGAMVLPSSVGSQILNAAVFNRYSRQWTGATLENTVPANDLERRQRNACRDF